MSVRKGSRSGSKIVVLREDIRKIKENDIYISWGSCGLDVSFSICFQLQSDSCIICLFVCLFVCHTNLKAS